MSTDNPLLPPATLPLLAEMIQPGYRGPEVISAVPFADPEWKLCQLEFFTGGAASLEDYLGKQFLLVGYLAKRTAFRDQRNPGQMRGGHFIGLVDENRNIVQTTSSMVAQTLDMLTITMGAIPFVPPVCVEFMEGKSASGTFHNLKYIRKENQDDGKLAFPRRPAKRS